MTLKEEAHVLVVFPHPDDEAFGVSATIMKYRDMGVPVTYACLTYGDMGRNVGNPPSTREDLWKIRKAEQEEAGRLMNLSELKFYGYRDKTLEFEEKGKIKGDVLELLHELKPTRLISFYPGYCVHPDHEATAEAVLDAVAELAPEDRPTLTLVAFDKRTYEDLGEPQIQTEVRDYTDRKMKVLSAHASQTAQLLIDLSKDTQIGELARERWFEKENFYLYDIEDWINNKGNK
ncbi:bacillithiol biosynthesis deacetylase BshB2 [Phocicoccus schoeneichii]|uniref:bacillithiol biosynthesis deacetylase BshB2 n=1 Tax=Phocicoccus schoeneichii TaxID=1812261 RepID=UPI003D0A930E